MIEYLTLFETMTEYEEYMEENTIFPNVSYIKDNNKVHYLRTKPLADIFLLNEFYIDECDFILQSMLKQMEDAGASGSYFIYFNENVWGENARKCTDSKLQEYIENVWAYDFNGEKHRILGIGYYDFGLVYFQFDDEYNTAGYGFTVSESSKENGDYGQYCFAAG